MKAIARYISERDLSLIDCLNVSVGAILVANDAIFLAACTWIAGIIFQQIAARIAAEQTTK